MATPNWLPEDFDINQLAEMDDQELRALIPSILDKDLPSYDPSVDAVVYQALRTPLPNPLATVIVLDGIPVIKKDREERLRALLTKFFTSRQLNVKRMELPFESSAEGASSLGFAFIEFDSEAAANKAIEQANGFPFDKAHTFLASPFDDVDRMASMSDEYVPPVIEEYHEKEYLYDWLMDPEAREQFVFRSGEETRVCWSVKTDEEPPIAYNRASWTDGMVHWSPMGSYVVTYHKQGIALWGGSRYRKLKRFAHANVRLCEFSPREKYLVTYNQIAANSTEENMHIWNVETANIIQSFSVPGLLPWPVLRWSHDDSFCARLDGKKLRVYTLPDMKPLQNKIEVDAPSHFQWCPSANILSIYSQVSENDLGRVTLIELPSRKIVRVLNLSNISECKMYWQSKGDYLALNVTRAKPKAMGANINCYVMRMRKKDVPIETLQLTHESIISLNWEPNGTRFGVLAGSMPNHVISLYNIDEKDVKLIRSLEKVNANTMLWSPRGDAFVLGGVGGKYNGLLEFWHFQSPSQLEQMQSTEHFFMTNMEWDASGKYLATFTSWMNQQNENSIVLWDYRGKQLQRLNFVDKDRGLWCFAWRPKPASLLSEEKKQDVLKHIKSYVAKFKDMDEQANSAASKIMLERRQRLVDDWNNFLELRRQEHDKFREANPRFALPAAPQLVQVIDTVEQLLSETRS